jgi:hypothetical protein
MGTGGSGCGEPCRMVRRNSKPDRNNLCRQEQGDNQRSALKDSIKHGRLKIHIAF